MSAVALKAPARIAEAHAPDDGAAYDALLGGMRAGRFAGRPLPGDGPRALVDVLRRLEWPVDPRALAAAMPHYPDALGLAELRATLGNLGYETHRQRLRGRNLADGTVALVLAHGTLMAVGGPAGARAPATVGVAGALRPLRRYDCVCVAPARPAPEAPFEGVVAFVRRRFRRELGLLLVLTLLSGANLVAASLSIGAIFSAVLPADALDTLAMLLAGIVALMAFELALRRLRARLVADVSMRLEYELGTKLYAKLLALPIEMTTGASVADQTTRLKQFETVRDAFSGPIASTLLEAPLVAIMVLAVAVINPTCAAIVLGGIGLHALLGAAALPQIREAQAAAGRERARADRMLDEALTNRSQIVRRGLGTTVAARLVAQHGAVVSSRLRAEAARRRIGVALHVLTPLTGAGVLAVGAVQAMAGAMSGGALIVCMILTMRLLSPVQGGLLLITRLPELRGLLAQIDALLCMGGAGGAPRPEAARLGVRAPRSGRLRLERVTLLYPGAAAPALRDVSLEIPPGRLAAITGPSGAGKSTLLRAVVGRHALRAGRILVGGHDLAQIGAGRRAEMVGHLGHQPLVIHGSVLQNLTLGMPEATDEDLRSVCDELGLLGAIERLPDGFDTRLSDAAIAEAAPALRTKLAIARLLLRAPSILLLDEPEARLSPADEARLMTALRARVARGMTCLMVTHRPSLARAADLRVELEAGRARAPGDAARAGRRGVGGMERMAAAVAAADARRQDT